MISEKISKYKNQILFITIMAAIAVMVPVVLTQGPAFAGPVIFVLVLGIAGLYIILNDFKQGIPILFLYSSSIFIVNRILRASLPLGVVFELLIVIIFLSMLLQFRGQKKVDWKFNHIANIATVMLFGFFALQIANPFGSIMGWVASLRFFSFFALFLILLHFFTEYKSVKTFVIVWLAVATLAGAYALFQEIFGLRDFELAWVNADPKRYNLLFNWGRMRKFSFLSDPSAFGIFSAFTASSLIILLFGPFKKRTKLIMLAALIIIVPGMSFAGTRTAYALVSISVVFFVLLNLRNRNILIGSTFMIIVFLAVLFGPFYSAPIIRLRSTFQVKDDPSMGVRDEKRIRFQSYIQTHPFGGGVNTAGHNGARYARGHPLAGDFDPDSGYLRAALEQGTIGLAIALFLNCIVVIVGVKNYFRLHSPRMRILNLAFVVPFLGLSMANFTQDAFYQKPICILYFGTIALMIRMKDLDEKYITEIEQIEK